MQLVESPTTVGDLLLSDWQIWMQGEGLSHRTWTSWPAIVARVARDTGHDPTAFTASLLVRWLARYPNPNTKVTYYRALRAWHGWLVRTGHRADDPTAKMNRPKIPRGTPHPVSTAGLERLLSLRLHARTRAMILLAAYEGLRVHEIAKVRAEDFCLDAEEPTLRVVGKGGVEAVLPVHPLVDAVAVALPRRGWWFPSYTHPRSPVRSESVSMTITHAFQRAGVAGSAHSLRHWFATQALRNGADMLTVQQLLRHASPATTAIYAQVDARQMRAAVLRLPNPRQPAPTGAYGCPEDAK